MYLAQGAEASRGPNDRVVYASREAGTTIENEYHLLDDRRKTFKNSRASKHGKIAPINRGSTSLKKQGAAHSHRRRSTHCYLQIV